ncbi:hypothetical protein PS15p_210083 [Mucor circinelloides]
MFISTLKSIFYCFYPLEAGEPLDARREHNAITTNKSNTTIRDSPLKSNVSTNSLRRSQRLKRSIQQTKEPTTANAATTNTTTADVEWVVPNARTTLLKPKIEKDRCQGCGLGLSDDQNSLRYQQRQISGLCLACKKMFKFAENDTLIRRFKRSKKSNSLSRQHELRFKRYVHRMQGQKNSIFSKVELYHLPLSIHYYQKLGKRIVYHSSYPRDNTVSHFRSCSICRLFVSSRRRSLANVTQLSKRKRKHTLKEGSNVATFQDLFQLMVSSNSSCAFSGQKGIWCSPFQCPTKNPLYALSLDHKVPLSKGGLSTVDNLQVSLVCLNAIKDSHSNQEFVKWWKAFRQKQGCL